ncbi:MAG TPA: ASKHA domain-containing protein [Candidatus Acidoferrum sp.]|nr:ASKHA domain-containing protein [Candidatus Acidoferrum sp.]
MPYNERVTVLVTVRFEPEGRVVRAERGENLRLLASASGVFIRSDCNGDGTCGKCRIVIAENGRTLGQLTSSEQDFLMEREVHQGYRLACQISVNEDLVVRIPEETGLRIRQVQSTGLERKMPLQPRVKKIHVTVSQPTLSDVLPDSERLMQALQHAGQHSDLRVDPDLLPALPRLLREFEWDVTAVLPTPDQVCALERGDTTSSGYGYAVDIGTSKLVGVLINFVSGETVNTLFVENPQLVYGEDIMSRMSFAMKAQENSLRLRSSVLSAINQLLERSCAMAQTTPAQVYELVIVGNTAMHHFLLGIESRYLALSPYVPALKEAIDLHAKNVGILAHPHANVHLLPLIAGYVGADAVADVLASGIRETDELSLLLDIGTNTELFVGHRNAIVSCSCASGPAFEGAHIRQGMKAVHGAIERVRVEPTSLNVEVETVGGEKPVGICGSGILDAVAELLKCHVIDSKGRFRKVDNKRLIEVSGDRAFVLAWGNETSSGDPVVITQKDIGEVQLAKAAIHAGCQILMTRAGVQASDLKRIYIAGSFGNYVNPASAKFLGLIPEVPTEIIRFVGNTAIAGAKMCLSSAQARMEAKAIGQEVSYIELGADPGFSKEFAASMYLPHQDRSLYPETCALLGLE